MSARRKTKLPCSAGASVICAPTNNSAATGSQVEVKLRGRQGEEGTDWSAGASCPLPLARPLQHHSSCFFREFATEGEGLGQGGAGSEGGGAGGRRGRRRVSGREGGEEEGERRRGRGGGEGGGGEEEGERRRGR